SEVQAICDRVGILRGGELKAVERVDSLTQAKFRWVTLRLNEAVSPRLVEGLPGVSEISAFNNTLRFQLNRDFDPLLRAISGQYVVDIRIEEPSLEEIFLAFYGGDAPAANASVQKAQVN